MSIFTCKTQQQQLRVCSSFFFSCDLTSFLDQPFLLLLCDHLLLLPLFRDSLALPNRPFFHLDRGGSPTGLWLNVIFDESRRAVWSGEKKATLEFFPFSFLLKRRKMRIKSRYCRWYTIHTQKKAKAHSALLAKRMKGKENTSWAAEEYFWKGVKNFIFFPLAAVLASLSGLHWCMCARVFSTYACVIHCAHFSTRFLSLQRRG